ncbi:MAG TPA: hypothetical protein V6D48_04170 [Oculatellaceae cyanobacterium]
MSLHLFFSTQNPDVDRFGGYQSAATSVEFLFEGKFGSIAEQTAECGNHFNQEFRIQESGVNTGEEYLTSNLRVHSWQINQKSNIQSPKSIDAGIFPAADPQVDIRSGRYRRKSAVPI